MNKHTSNPIKSVYRKQHTEIITALLGALLAITLASASADLKADYRALNSKRVTFRDNLLSYRELNRYRGVSKGMLREVFLALPAGLFEHSHIWLAESLLGGSIELDVENKSAKLSADGSQESDIVMTLAYDEKYGLIVKVSEELRVGGSGTTMYHLRRVAGGWVDMKRGLDKDYTTSDYEAKIGGKVAQFRLHWEKEGKIVFGYYSYESIPKVYYPVDGANFQAGALMLNDLKDLDEMRTIWLAKTDEGEDLFWKGSAETYGKGKIAVELRSK